MAESPLAGQPAPRELLINVPRLVSTYYKRHPDPEDPAQRVAFGTSGHRGTSLDGSFNEDHVLAICQALVEYRQQQGITGPLYIGKDTHALSEPAEITAIEVFVANGVVVRYQTGQGYTPTPSISLAILGYNRGRTSGLADGVVITPSHNPPGDGGFKYNPPAAGPAGPEITKVVQERANAILRDDLRAVRRVPYEKALKAGNCRAYDFVVPYVADLKNVIDVGAIASAGLRIGVDPMGGAAADYWEPIEAAYGLDITVVNPIDRPHLRLHDRRPRRQDPHGLLLAGRHDLPDPPEGPLRYRLRQRPGRRPARHRDPFGRLDEPQPLPGHGHLVPVPAPPRLAQPTPRWARPWSPAR